MRRLEAPRALIALLTLTSVVQAQGESPATSEPPSAAVPAAEAEPPQPLPAPEETPPPPAPEEAPPPPELPEQETARGRARAKYTLARTAYAQGRFAEALQLIDGAFELQDAPTLLLARAYTLDKLGRPSDAKRAYLSYLRRRPDDPEKSRIELRMRELDGDRTVTPTVGSQAAGPVAPDEPKGPKPPFVHDGPLLIRLSGFVGALYGSRVSPGDEDDNRKYFDLFYGVGASVGVDATPGLAIALEAQFMRSNLAYKDVDSEDGDEKDSGSDSGFGLGGALEAHVFPSPTSGFHLVAGAGWVGLGHDDFDRVSGVRAHLGAGSTFWLQPQLALDPMLRVDVVPFGGHDATVGFVSANVGLLWH